MPKAIGSISDSSLETRRFLAMTCFGEGVLPTLAEGSVLSTQGAFRQLESLTRSDLTKELS